ncbi:unnamed protein product [Peronospora belbahrii]|uniref:Uncharacterized protein n=1 Tax=Peronospora belbahrii TaxID=622444 RepID=A0ABN8CVC1_9STRA|nr:unnamed protein product [Peronospora belbahrii]
MGALLVCFGMEESDDGHMRQQKKVSRRHSYALLDRIQINWNGRHFDEEDEEVINWDNFMLQSNKSTASSGRRMLSAFYSRLLEENNDYAFYFDTKGKRMKGAYLYHVELLENYFEPFCGQRRTQKSPYPVELVEMYSLSDECFSTSSTMMSDVDYGVSVNSSNNNLSHLLILQPVLGRSSSLGPPVHTSIKIHRAITSPHLEDDLYFAHLHSPWNSHQFKLENHDLSSPKSFLSRTFTS